VLALGLDIGTTATKAVLIDDAGRVVAGGERPTELRSPRPGWAEEDPAAWWDNVQALCRQLPVANVAAVGVSGMVPCVILLDAQGRVLRPSIQQNDARAVREVAELRARFPDEEAVLRTTGSAITQQSVGPTLLWLQRHEPDVWARTHAVLGSYDLIARLLGAEPALERNWALESGLLDLASGEWSREMCAAVELDPALLAPVRSASTVVGGVSRSAADATGLAAGTPIVAGAADHVAAALAAGVVEEGDVLVKLGGAGDILLSTATPLLDARLYLDDHLVPGQWLPNGCMAASGSALKWFQAELAGGAALAHLDEEAAAAGPGAGGVVALPYLLGEKTPIHDPEARGAFAGLHLGHRRGHLARALLEAVACGFRHHVEVFAEHGLRPGRWRVTDGGARSPLWRQILADVLGARLEATPDRSASAVGAAFAAGMGVGMFGAWAEIERFVAVTAVAEPDPATEPVYADLYGRYRALYPALRSVLDAARPQAVAA
jgi:xylulokinase